MSRIKTKPLPQRFPEMFLLSVYGVCIICAIIAQFNGGIVAIKSDGNLGTGPLSFDGGTLEALAAGGGIVSRRIGSDRLIFAQGPAYRRAYE